MKHVKRITIARAEYTAEEVNGFLDRIFSFVTTIVNAKSKNAIQDA